MIHAGDQAKARTKIKEAGGEVEWGKHYSGSSDLYKFSKAEVGALPALNAESE